LRREVFENISYIFTKGIEIEKRKTEARQGYEG